MPYSDYECKFNINLWLNPIRNEVARVLDLGVGSGTYFDYYAVRYNKLSKAEWYGIEVWQPYIEQFCLEQKYTKIYNADLRKFDYSILPKIDLVFAGDVLEHMDKKSAINIVKECKKISKYLIISIPIVHYPQEAINGNPYEAHVKDDWSHQEVVDTFDGIIKYHQGSLTGAYLIHVNT